MNTLGKNKYYHDFVFKKFFSEAQTVIVVAHVIETSEEFLMSLNKNIGISLLIPKISSMQQDSYNKLKSSIPIQMINKEDINAHNIQLLDYFEQIVGNNSFVICDIGGYFSGVLLELGERFNGTLLGIVEDTENGVNKYKKALEDINAKKQKISYPIISVAQSPLKECEDYLVGKEICLKSEIFLSRNEIPIFGKKVLVLGFGKIGRSAAITFRERGTYVTVIDTNPIRQALAVSYGFRTGQLEAELNNCDIILGATGNHCIGNREISKIKNRKVYIFSVTSPDDEFDSYNRLMQSGRIDADNNLVITNELNGEIVFVHNGSAINFKESRSILSNNIKLVQSELCVSLCKIQEFEKGKISEISKETRERLAAYWLYEQNYREEIQHAGFMFDGKK